MGDDPLKSCVLELGDADESRIEPARPAALAELEDPDVLSEALGGASEDLAGSAGATSAPKLVLPCSTWRGSVSASFGRTPAGI